jgi:hypothetical protein
MALLTMCTPFEETRARVFGDLHPPQLEGLAMESPHMIVARFDEATSLSPKNIRLEPDLGVAAVESDSEHVVIETREKAVVGAHYTVNATVEDEAGNTLTFMLDLTGYNPDPARVIINELTPQGSGNRPDLVELLVVEGGNLGGVSFYAGSPRENSGSLIFPAMEVDDGDYLIIHLKPQGIPEEVSETADPSRSGGRDAHPEAWDFWLSEPGGLGGNNGAVSVYAYQDGPLLDAVIYSNRRYDPEDRYGSFGTKSAQLMITDVVDDGGWAIAGETVRPEDAIDPEDSTATRSISRNLAGRDTDSAADWHITPTRGASFGEKNDPRVYTPD